jgi:LAO/AO transport system kinase
VSAARPPLDRRVLGRAFSVLASHGPEALDPAVWASLEAGDARARRIGLTGAPGAGKSTLAGRLALHRLHHAMAGQRMGILAVDPSSPQSGGAILGDRIRMDELPGAAELYIRSVGSRATTDGLADHLPDMMDLLDAHQFDEVLLETVGVGQAEYAVRAQVDTLALVLLPESGDTVQAMKAGIMELADIYVVNKADLPGAQKMAAEVKHIVTITPRAAGQWKPPVLLVSSSQPESIAALSGEIDRHQAWLAADAQRQRRLHAQRARYRLRRRLERRLAQTLATLDDDFFDAPLAQQMSRALTALGE